MRRFLSLLALVVPLAVPATAVAGTVSASGQVSLSGTIAPARYIIVTPADPAQLEKVISNTDQDVTPQVYVGHLPGPTAPLTPQLLSSYKALLAAHPSFRVGELAAEPSHAAMVTRAASPNPRPIILQTLLTKQRF